MNFRRDYNDKHYSRFFIGLWSSYLNRLLNGQAQADKERADYMQAEIDALRSALVGEAEEDTEED